MKVTLACPDIDGRISNNRPISETINTDNYSCIKTVIKVADDPAGVDGKIEICSLTITNILKNHTVTVKDVKGFTDSQEFFKQLYNQHLNQ